MADHSPETDDTADYVTMIRSGGPDAKLWLVAIMRYQRESDSHIMREVSQRLTYHGAVHLASQWSKEKSLEVRYIGKRH